MIAVALFLISFALIVFIFYPLWGKWFDAGVRQYEEKEPDVCAHTKTTLLSYWIDENGKMRRTNYCESCGELVRGSNIQKGEGKCV